MGYQVKWVEEHLGITRKALRLYEEKGLIPKNKNGQYRIYDDEDIERIWSIKVLQGMGYTLSELAELCQRQSKEEFDFQSSIAKKVKQLEGKKADVERHLGYAKMIQFTGRFPTRPKEMGSLTFEAFQKQTIDSWNIHADSRMEGASKLMELIDIPSEDWGETEVDELLASLVDFGMHQAEMEASIGLHTLIKAIIARTPQGADSPEVQLLVKVLYEQLQEFDLAANMSPCQFGRSFSSSFMEGQLGLINQQKYGIDGCAFVADAIAIFGGYMNYADIT